MKFSEQDLQILQEGAGKAASLLKAIGNENRLLVLCLLIQHDEMSVSTILERVGLSQSALSQHLARMRQEGLVSYRRESQVLYYRIANPEVEKIIAVLKSIYCP
ncbi:metalloregulator ArsR/SmtB family transcription factor [Pusillimonas sp. MFBS29]|uniref:ArsR/SmtB family transcription factor n=1 Tax=Pusillimonas sp. MFBS29 TaxID=2886690 RepID=UPI001D0F8A9B|nr:metalloregulator ArsR/SmtB family transcription factor [Pusillimonas sp. MFBS29]MCC2595720.1 metalloregulator ArsR/SmtB family transcription factor [Pusillimonas sp. MFBS29]